MCSASPTAPAWRPGARRWRSSGPAAARAGGATAADAHHWLILHGRYVCLARRPLCERCSVARCCDHARAAQRAELTRLPPRYACRAAPTMTRQPLHAAMSKLEDLAERVERLVLRHEELKRTNALLEQQLAASAPSATACARAWPRRAPASTRCSSACPPDNGASGARPDEADRSHHPRPELHPGLPRRRRGAAAARPWPASTAR